MENEERYKHLNKYYKDFVRGGANLSAEDKEKLKKSIMSYRYWLLNSETIC